MDGGAHSFCESGVDDYLDPFFAFQQGADLVSGKTEDHDDLVTAGVVQVIERGLYHALLAYGEELLHPPPILSPLPAARRRAEMNVEESMFLSRLVYPQGYKMKYVMTWDLLNELKQRLSRGPGP